MDVDVADFFLRAGSGTLALLAAFGIGVRVGGRHAPSATPAASAEAQAEIAALRAVAAAHTVPWSWPETSVTRWVPVEGLLADRRYERTMAKNLEQLREEMEALPYDVVWLTVSVIAEGMWSVYLQRAHGARTTKDTETKRISVMKDEVFVAPPKEIVETLVARLRDASLRLWTGHEDGSRDWRSVSDPVLLWVRVQRQVVQTPEPRPEVRFVEVPVVSAAPPPEPPVDRDWLAAQVEVQVAEALARQRSSPPS
mgnify:FL=1